MHGTDGAILLWLGIALLGGYAANVLGKRIRVPRIPIMILLGVLSGPSVFDLIPDSMAEALPVVAHLALVAVAFLLGEEFIYYRSRHRKETFLLTAWIGLSTAALVTLGLFVVSGSLPLALIAGSIAAATAVANTMDVVQEARAKGPLTNALLGVVAADNALSISLFTIALAMAEALSGEGASLHELLTGAWSIAGAAMIGVALGIPMAALSRLPGGKPAVLGSFGIVLITAGLSETANVSFLLAAMVLGGTYAWRAKSERLAVEQIKGLIEPLLALFFLFAGYKLDLGGLAAIGVLGIVYIVARIAGRLLGTLTTAVTISHQVRVRLGWCLFPQAGVAFGLALLASDRIPEVESTLMPLIVATTIPFELVGPFLLRWQLGRAGEIGRADDAETALR